MLVAHQVLVDIDHHIELGFLHPNTGIVTAQGLVCVAWGLTRLGLADEGRCRRILKMLDQHLESCGPTEVARALDCFAAANYSSTTMPPSRIAKTIESLYNEASGHDITRYLYWCPRFGITAFDLKKQLADRLLQVADEP